MTKSTHPPLKMIDEKTTQEVVRTLVDLKNLLDRLLMQGLVAVDDEALLLLRQAQSLFAEQGAGYLANRFQILIDAIDAGTAAAVPLLQLQTALFLFERLFTQSVCLNTTQPPQ